MEWTVRASTTDDIDAIRRIEVDAGVRFRDVGLDEVADDEPPPAEALLDHVRDDRMWVAVDVDDGLIGYSAAAIVDGEGHLDQVSVVPAAAGHGVGRALIERVHDWARGLGLEAVTLTTFSDVVWNGPFYERLGYEPLSTAELGPELAAIRAAETAAGLDVSPRQAMRIRL